MPEEKKDIIKGIQFAIEDIDDGREALMHIISGFMYFFAEPKRRRWTMFVIVLLSLLVWQSVTNFEMIQSAVNAFVA